MNLKGQNLRRDYLGCCGRLEDSYGQFIALRLLLPVKLERRIKGSLEPFLLLFLAHIIHSSRTQN